MGISLKIYRKVFPAPPPPPTIAFGKLPKLSFPEQKDLPKFTFSIETPTVGLPKLPTQAKVYFMPKSSVNLLSFDEAKQKAAKLGFKSEPSRVTETILRFSDPGSASALEVNIVSGIFSISYNLSADPSPLSKQPPAPAVAISQVKSFLTQNGLLLPDLDEEGVTSTQFLSIDNDKLVNVLSLSEAKLVKVNLFRKGHDKIPTVTLNPKQANVWFLVGGTGKVVAGEYHYFPVDETQVATYPLKTAAEALNDLNSGSGFIASVGDNTDGKVAIRKIYLAYFDPASPADQFFQPIVVFSGDRDFVAYVPAVAKAYYGE